MSAPDIRIVAVDEILLKEVVKVIKTSPKLTYAQYDTTFNLTTLYTSILSIVHPLIELVNGSSPPVPIVYLLHERKTETSHLDFWRFIKENCPDLMVNTFLVTDCEDAIRNSIKKTFPNIRVLRCWNHFFASTESWIRKHGGKISDVSFYIESLRELLLQDTQADFDECLKHKQSGFINNFGTKTVVWSSEFNQYFIDNILSDIHDIAKFSVKEIAGEYFNNYTGITTNHAEGLNSLFKDLNNKHSVPIDTLCLSLLHITIYYSNEIKIAFSNTGNYRLKPQYAKFKIDRSFIHTRDTMEPSKIIHVLIQQNLYKCVIQAIRLPARPKILLRHIRVRKAALTVVQLALFVHKNPNL